MINKTLVKRRFEKSLETYDDNAFIQKVMADNLIKMLPQTDFNSIFEIGCATGILTKKIKEKLNFKEFHSNDIAENAKQYIDKIIPTNSFILGDIEKTELDYKYDLIISNACLQWCNDINSVISKLMKSINKNGVLAVSIFGDNNLNEIKNLFNFENKMYSTKELQEFLKEYNLLKYEEDIQELYFKSPIDVLKHIKYTGANALTELPLTKSKLKQFEKEYISLYSVGEKVKLTYNPIYIILKHKQQ